MNQRFTDRSAINTGKVSEAYTEPIPILVGEVYIKYEVIKISTLNYKSVNKLNQVLTSFNWDWLVTGTFNKEITDLTANEIVTRYFQKLEKRLQIPIPRFWVLEPHSNIERPHMHAVVGNLSGIKGSAKVAYKLWTEKGVGGRFRTSQIETRNGAVRYVLKYLTKTGIDSDWNFHHLDKFQDYDFHAFPVSKKEWAESYLEAHPELR